MIYFYLLNYVIPILFVGVFFAASRFNKRLSAIVGIFALLFLFSLPVLNTSGLYPIPFKIIP